MFDVNNLKLTNVANIREKFLTEVPFQELKEIIYGGLIDIDISKDVPYIPLEGNETIYLNINKSAMEYDTNNKEFYIKDKFFVIDGEIRLIGFMNDFSEVTPPDKKIMLNISCLNTSEIPEIIRSIISKDDCVLTIEIPKMDANRRKEIEKLDKAHRDMMTSEDNIINFGSQFLNREISALIDRNEGNGWHRIIPIISKLKEEGKTDIEIANTIKDMMK